MLLNRSACWRGQTRSSAREHASTSLFDLLALLYEMTDLINLPSCETSDSARILTDMTCSFSLITSPSPPMSFAFSGSPMKASSSRLDARKCSREFLNRVISAEDDQLLPVSRLLPMVLGCLTVAKNLYVQVHCIRKAERLIVLGLIFLYHRARYQPVAKWLDTNMLMIDRGT